MEGYDEKDVPILDFHNPAHAIYYPDGLYTYAMGNTRKRSITEQIGTTKEQHLDLLFLACGDLRNVLCTVSELSQRRSHHCPKSIDIHLNDYDPSILPRNAIILDIIEQINPDIPDDMDFLWNVWYNMALSEAHGDRLRQVITPLINRDMDDENGMILRFQDSRTQQECLNVWKDWLDLKIDLETIKEKRIQLIKRKISRIKDSCQQVLTKALPSNHSHAQSLVLDEIENWFKNGATTTAESTYFINPTLIRPFTHNWKVHYASCPFEGYCPLKIADVERCKSITSVCKEILALWVKQFQQFSKQHSIKISLWAGDALWLCTSGLPNEMLFDVIDTSNVSDHIGLLNVLICCGPRLKSPLESQLQTSSILWCNHCKNIQEYYDRCIGIHTNLLPTVLGLHLAVDLDMGNRKLSDGVFSNEEWLYWVKAETVRTPLSLTSKESDIIKALCNMTERCFNLIEDLFDGQMYGASLSSPLTLLRVIHQMGPLVQGGASRILGLLEAKLPSDFYRDHGFEWRLVKSIGNQDGGPVVEVQVDRLQLSVTELFKDKTPIPKLVLFLVERHPFNILLSKFSSYPVISNCIRFNIKEGTVTFHMLESDWKALDRNSLFNIVEHGSGFPVFSCKPFNLSDDNVHVKYADPVVTFGLHAVQTFCIQDSSVSSSALLEITKIEEENDLYTAELAILDTDKCNAKDMTIHFIPESRPVKIDIHFLSSVGYKMTFSCPVAHSSKFQLSKKQRRIFWRIPKKVNWVTGEMALKNPAQVPFYAMEKWDIKSDDIALILGRMFLTQRDRQLALGEEIGPPFHALRESIKVILTKELEPQSQVVYSVEDNEHILSLINQPLDILSKIGLIIKVRKPIYKWDNLPYAKCVFYDCKQHTDIMDSNPVRAHEMAREFWKNAHDNRNAQGIHRIIAEPGEIELFRRMLYTNAARTEQENPAASVWKDAFICPLYPRDSIHDAKTNVMELSSIHNKLKALAESTNHEGTFPLDRISQQETHSEVGQTNKPAYCAFCRKMSTELKRCTKCKKVSYCNRECQAQHWKKQHKRECFVSAEHVPNTG